MDNITLTTISNSVEQINNRVDDINKRFDETNASLRLLITENSNAHREINKQIDYVTRLISKVDKESSVCSQKLDDHLKHHRKEENRANINGVKISSMIGNVISAAIGALAVLYSTGTI